MKRVNLHFSPALVTALGALLLASVPVHGEETLSGSAGAHFDENLVPVESTNVAMAFIDPNADFGVFKRIALLEPTVAFRANWKRDQNRNTTKRVSASDMERIKSDLAALFKTVFTDRLEAAGFKVVNGAAEDVLLVRAAIIDLDITAPDDLTSGRSKTFTTSAGSATLYMELYDSLSGDILGRAADRQTVRQGKGRLSWSNRVTNKSDAQRMLRRWADQLITFLKSHYNEP